jgi:hypothetical protein
MLDTEWARGDNLHCGDWHPGKSNSRFFIRLIHMGLYGGVTLRRQCPPGPRSGMPATVQTRLDWHLGVSRILKSGGYVYECART